jgi:uncharacterized protein YuzE
VSDEEHLEVLMDTPGAAQYPAPWQAVANALVTACPDAHAVYVRVREGTVARTTFVHSLVGVDRDPDGRVLGIEILHTVDPDTWGTAWGGIPAPGHASTPGPRGPHDRD